MTIDEAILERHSVREYLDTPLSDELKEKISLETERINQLARVRFQAVFDDPSPFDSLLAKYGRFTNVRNYLCLVAGKSDLGDETVGYWGEHMALFLQMLGLNSCFVAMTFSKSKAKNKCIIEDGEKLYLVLAFGYGKTNGTGHKSKNISDVTLEEEGEDIPEWYRKGLEYALLAPTNLNQQKFVFSRTDDSVFVRASGGFYSSIDLGIVKYNFEVGAGKENFVYRSTVKPV